ncbi:putative telomeric repeat-binding factor 1, partial [Triplophysa rosa]
NMEQKSHDMISSTTDFQTDFQAVDGVVQSWMIDYYFTSLCRLFRDRSAGKFRRTLNIFQATVDELESCSASRDHSSQRTICCFLARVVDGEELNVHYEKNDQVTPLMSAVHVWDLLEDLVSDSTLHTKIRNLLIVQVIVNGNSQMGKDTLQWLEEETQIPEKLHGKLTSIVNKKDAYDQLLMNLTYNQLLEKIDMFLDSQEDASHFLLEAALKVVQARQERSDQASCEQDGGKKANDGQVDPLVVNNRHKKKLLSKQVGPWKPETAKKKQRMLRRSSVCEVTQRSSVPSVLESNISTTSRSRRKWTSEEDKKLKAGVRQYGVGKWASILIEFDFENRTSVMLKDRWRTMKKHNMV